MEELEKHQKNMEEYLMLNFYVFYNSQKIVCWLTQLVKNATKKWNQKATNKDLNVLNAVTDQFQSLF